MEIFLSRETFGEEACPVCLVSIHSDERGHVQREFWRVKKRVLIPVAGTVMVHACKSRCLAAILANQRSQISAGLRWPRPPSSGLVPFLGHHRATNHHVLQYQMPSDKCRECFYRHPLGLREGIYGLWKANWNHHGL